MIFLRKKSKATIATAATQPTTIPPIAPPEIPPSVAGLDAAVGLAVLDAWCVVGSDEEHD